VSVVLDAGALIAIERRDDMVMSLLELLRRSGHHLRAPAPVVGQVWRDGSRQAVLARFLAYVDVREVDQDTSRAAGVLLGRAGRSDIVDALVAVQTEPGDVILTSDPDDLGQLAEHLPHRVRVVTV
jgi:hypothetical protein